MSIKNKINSTQDSIVLTGVETKKCTKCGEVKILESFYKRGKYVEGYRNQCKKCCAEMQIIWDKNNPEKVKAKDVKWKKNNPKKIKDHTAKYYAAHSEKAKAYSAEWAKANPEKKKAKNAVYRKSHREQAKAYTAAWRAKNPGKEKASAAEYRAKNPGRDAEWRAKNPEKAKANKHKRRARKLAAGGSFTGAAIRQMLKQQKGKCIVCKKDITNSYHIDHIMPLAHGGSNGIQNIQLLCPHCNCTKSAKHPINFMQERGFLL